MGVHLPSVQSSAVVVANSSAGVENIAIQLPPLNLPLDNAAVYLGWYMRVTSGAGVTAEQIQLRRNSITGTALLNATAITMTASSTYLWGGVWFDTPGVVGGQVYVLTHTPTGGNDSVIDAAMWAFVL